MATMEREGEEHTVAGSCQSEEEVSERMKWRTAIVVWLGFSKSDIQGWYITRDRKTREEREREGERTRRTKKEGGWKGESMEQLPLARCVGRRPSKRRVVALDQTPAARAVGRPSTQHESCSHGHGAHRGETPVSSRARTDD